MPGTYRYRNRIAESACVWVDALTWSRTARLVTKALISPVPISPRDDAVAP